MGIKIYVEADGPSEEALMASVNELLARLDATGANLPTPEVELSEAFAKLDAIDSKIDAIYTPDEPPAPPAGTGE